MKNNKIIVAVLIVVIASGLAVYVRYSTTKNISSISEPVTPSAVVLYDNTEYGFTFSLPDTWKGYSVIKNTWEGNPLIATSIKETGIKLIVRNPKWTPNLPYEDIPILIFTVAQWDSYVAGNFAISAAPIEAIELARNNLYVFALPPRWDFDYSEGHQEAQDIVASRPIKAYFLQQ